MGKSLMAFNMETDGTDRQEQAPFEQRNDSATHVAQSQPDHCGGLLSHQSISRHPHRRSQSQNSGLCYDSPVQPMLPTSLSVMTKI
jgi:hypothetical protein